MKKLSILICSLHRRKHFLDKLLNVLNPQLNDSVEVIVDTDNGQKTIGQKRNDLLDRSVGSHICFIDDDDLVSNDYVSKILNALKENPDVVGMEGIITFNGVCPKLFKHSIKNKWEETPEAYLRFPNHLNPVKRELAMSIKFPTVNFGEDYNYGARLVHILKTEVYVEGPIYFYKFEERKKD